MTRLMVDCTHDAVPTITSPLDMIAGYVTGSPDIAWTAADWARFPGVPHVTIDQGFTGSPAAAAIVRDVEPGAWTPGLAVAQRPWTPARPTIYCDRYDLPAVLAAGWHGDLWLAYPGWSPGQPLPAAPGCTVVAVQHSQNIGGPFDLSIVLDDTWPGGGENMAIGSQGGWRWCDKCGSLFNVSAHASVCPAGGTHDGTQSYDYTLIHDSTVGS